MAKQAAILARVSTGVQDFQRQVNDLTELANSMGYEVREENIFSEKVSGFKKVDDRGALNQFVEEIRSGKKKYDMVFAESVSRIARKPKVGHEFVEELVELQTPVYVKSMKLASMTETGLRSRPFFMQFGMLLEFAQIEAEDNKDKFKSGKLQSLLEGRVSGGDRLIYGYKRGERVDGDRKAVKYEIDENEAKVVRMAYDMYLNGSGTKVIASYLNQQGIPSKTGKQWQIGTLNQILKNPFYYGTRKYKGKFYENVVPAIISKEDYEKKTALAVERNNNPDRAIKYLYLLKDRIYCGWCGGKYVAKFKEDKQSHYGCYNRSSNKMKKTCEAAGIGITMIESIVWQIVRSYLGVANYLEKHDNLVKQHTQDIKNLQLKIKSFMQEMEAKVAERTKWKKLYVKEIIGDDELSIEVGKIDTSVKNIQYKLQATKDEISTKTKMLEQKSNAKAFLAFQAKIGDDRVQINDVIKNVVEKVIITSTVTGVYTDLYIITVKMIGEPHPPTVLFNKRTMQYWDSIKALAKTKYDSNGLLVNDIQALVDVFKEPVIVTTTKGKSTKVIEPQICKVLPFTRLNMLKGNEPVVKPKTPRKAYKQKRYPKSK